METAKGDQELTSRIFQHRMESILYEPTLSFNDLPSELFTQRDMGMLALLGLDYTAKTGADSLQEIIAAYEVADIPLAKETVGRNLFYYEPLTTEHADSLPNERAFGIEIAARHDPTLIPVNKGGDALRPLYALKPQLPDTLVPVIGKLSDYLALELWHRADTGEALYEDPTRFVLTQSSPEPGKFYTIGSDMVTGGLRIGVASLSAMPRTVFLSPLIMPNQGRYPGASLYPLAPYS